MEGASGFLKVIWIVIAGAAYGVLLIGLGQAFAALREIALNTRAMRAEHGEVPEQDYAGLSLAGRLLMFGGCLVFVATAALLLVMLLGGAPLP